MKNRSWYAIALAGLIGATLILFHVFFSGQDQGRISRDLISGVQTPIQVHDERIGLFVLPDRIADRTENEITAEYLQGMPIVLNVRIVNMQAKQRSDAASEIELPSNWRRAVAFSASSAAGNQIHMEVIPCGKNEASAPVRLAKEDLFSNWIVPAAYTQRLEEGSYNLEVEFRGIKAKPIKIRLRKATTDQDRLQVSVRGAHAAYQCGNYGEAIRLSEEAMKDGRRLARDGDAYALLVAAQAHEAKQDVQKALAMYEEFYRTYVPTNPREDMYLLKLKIAELKKEAK